MNMIAATELVTLILCLVVIEAIVLSMHWHRTGRGIAPRALLVNLLAGACLMLALLCALLGQFSTMMLICLAFALCFHVLDLRWRWNQA